MIFEFIFQGKYGDFLLSNRLIPSSRIGLFLIIFVAFGLIILSLLYSYLEKNKKFQHIDLFCMFISILSLSGIYIYLFSIKDEVFISLEHVYNLVNHGIFSFSPIKRVDGTIEIVYNLFLLPFSFSKAGLIIGNYIIGLIIAIMHLIILWKLLNTDKVYIKLILSFIFIFSFKYFPLMELLSNGFGNNLLSLMFLYSLYLHIRNKTKPALIVASVLPLIRPDGIIYSLLIFTAYWLSNKENKIPYKYIIISFFVFSFVLLFFKIYYGHFIPSPLAFKSGMHHILYKITTFHHYELLIFPILILLILYLVRHKILVILNKMSVFFNKFDPPKNIIIIYLPLIFATLYLNYHMSAKIWWSPRYVICVYTFSILLLFFWGEIFLTYFFSLKFLLNIRPQYYLIPLFIFISFFLWNYRNLLTYDDWHTSDQYLCGGQIIGQLVPKEWRIAATEINSFGFGNDNEIIDLWGPTNYKIANSKICLYQKKKIYPTIIQDENPELFWYRTLPENISLNSDYNWEEYFLSQGNLDNSRYEAGDIFKLIEKYDLFMISNPNFPIYGKENVSRNANLTTTIFVRKDIVNIFKSNLETNNYKQITKRPIDVPYLHKKINEIFLEIGECL